MEQELYGVLVEGVRVLFIATIPIILGVAVAGLFAGALQSATTIYDVALGYAARVAAVIFVLYIFFPSVSQSMISLVQLALQ